MYWLEFIRPNLYDHIIIANMLNITYTMYLIVCMHVCMHVDYLCTVCVYAPLHVIGIYLGDPISRRRLGAVDGRSGAEYCGSGPASWVGALQVPSLEPSVGRP